MVVVAMILILEQLMNFLYVHHSSYFHPFLRAVQWPYVKTFSVWNILKLVVMMKKLMTLAWREECLWSALWLTAYKAGNHADANLPYIINAIILCPYSLSLPSSWSCRVILLDNWSNNTLLDSRWEQNMKNCIAFCSVQNRCTSNWQQLERLAPTQICLSHRHHTRSSSEAS